MLCTRVTIKSDDPARVLHLQLPLYIRLLKRMFVCVRTSSLFSFFFCLCFFFNQKTAYEIYYGLVGSEMCIRDRVINLPKAKIGQPERVELPSGFEPVAEEPAEEIEPDALQTDKYPNLAAQQ